MVIIKYRDSQKDDEIIDNSWECVIEVFMEGCFRLKIHSKDNKKCYSRYVPLALVEEIIRE